MEESSVTPLLQDVSIQKPSFLGRRFIFFSLLICAGFSSLPGTHAKYLQHLVIDALAVTMPVVQTIGGIPNEETMSTSEQHIGSAFAALKDNGTKYDTWADTFDLLHGYSVEPPTVGDTVMPIGRYKGRTFADLKDNEASYVNWALSLQDASGDMQAFVNYLKAEGIHRELPRHMTDELLHPSGDSVMAIGRYKGRTFADLKDNEPSYVNWALCLQDASGQLQAFVNYLKENAIMPLPPRGDTIMPIGQHRGRTFADLKDSEPGYGYWALKQKKLTADLQAFVDYLKAEGLSANLSTPMLSESLPPTGDSVMSIGEFRGRTFADLRINETHYASWALSQQDPTSGLRQFVEYLKAEAASGDLTTPDEEDEDVRQAKFRKFNDG